jgi:hypothetical protein
MSQVLGILMEIRCGDIVYLRRADLHTPTHSNEFSINLFLQRITTLRRMLSPVQDAMLNQRITLLRRTVNDKAKSIKTWFKAGRLVILECVGTCSASTAVHPSARPASPIRLWMAVRPRAFLTSSSAFIRNSLVARSSVRALDVLVLSL